MRTGGQGADVTNHTVEFRNYGNAPNDENPSKVKTNIWEHKPRTQTSTNKYFETNVVRRYDTGGIAQSV